MQTVTSAHARRNLMVCALAISAGGLLGCPTPTSMSLVSQDPGGEGDTCSGIGTWEDSSVQFEDAVLVLANARRAVGAICGSIGVFAPTTPLTMNSLLRCAARRHSLDMATRNFFDHTNPDGDGPGERIADVGYSATTWGENIAQGQTTPEQVVDGWMNSPGHCANIMNPAFTEIGIGHGPENTWTQVFAAPQ